MHKWATVCKPKQLHSVVNGDYVLVENNMLRSCCGHNVRDDKQIKQTWLCSNKNRPGKRDVCLSLFKHQFIHLSAVQVDNRAPNK